jgi:hypothetical protein
VSQVQVAYRRSPTGIPNKAFELAVDFFPRIDAEVTARRQLSTLEHPSVYKLLTGFQKMFAEIFRLDFRIEAFGNDRLFSPIS